MREIHVNAHDGAAVIVDRAAKRTFIIMEMLMGIGSFEAEQDIVDLLEHLYIFESSQFAIRDIKTENCLRCRGADGRKKKPRLRTNGLRLIDFGKGVLAIFLLLWSHAQP